MWSSCSSEESSPQWNAHNRPARRENFSHTRPMTPHSQFTSPPTPTSPSYQRALGTYAHNAKKNSCHCHAAGCHPARYGSRHCRLSLSRPFTCPLPLSVSHTKRWVSALVSTNTPQRQRKTPPGSFCETAHTTNLVGPPRAQRLHTGAVLMLFHPVSANFRAVNVCLNHFNTRNHRKFARADATSPSQ